MLCPEIELHLVTEECALWRATDRDLEVLGLSAPFWAFAWPGGQALARYVLDHPEEVVDRRVLDFGAGCGIEAIAAAIGRASKVVASDIDPIAASAIALNAALNHVELEATTRDFTQLVAAQAMGAFDVVLAGDMFYDDTAQPIVDWLEALARAGKRVLVGDPARGHLSGASLVALATYEAPADVDVSGKITRTTTVFAVGP